MSTKKHKKISKQSEEQKKSSKNLKLTNKKSQKSPIILVLPIEEISLQQELSSPACFRIQLGYPERDADLENVTIHTIRDGVNFQFVVPIWHFWWGKTPGKCKECYI